MTEERSMKEVLEIVLPKLIPESIPYRIIPHEGKSDLQGSITRKLRAWNRPARFIIIHDQDSNDCHTLKTHLVQLCEHAGKPDSLVRIACHQLESWFLGDLQAVGVAYQKNSLATLQTRGNFWQPDNLNNAKDVLLRLIPEHQQIAGSRAVAPHLSLANAHNRSHSFQVFMKGVRKIVREVHP
jgi:hypothetical protein